MIGEEGSSGTEACLDDPAIAEKVQRMDQARRDLGIRSRPSFVANDQLVQGALAYATFVDFLDGLLGKIVNQP